ncbi:MAG: D-lyxose/D-mannose family sugar isomerase [Clostridiales bacterium]|jgi:hypothetical protein|nr:D-lyxose/D-mannose family sugar isomerase [Clostridiales bacterium]
MKRSEINKALKRMEQLAGEYHFALPPFCSWTREEWSQKGAEYNEIRDNLLGWDITDYGLGNFKKIGFSLITLRNGNMKNPAYRKPYAEKLLMLEEEQSAPMHFHWSKMEDIINRGGGTVLIRVYNAAADESLADTEVTVNKDGRKLIVPAGTQIALKPGESITIQQYLYHDFTVEKGTGAVLLGEVSMCNDDEKDNRFYEPVGRFPTIEEDEPAYRLLCNEYPPAPQ